MMKRFRVYLSVLTLALALFSCKKENKEAETSTAEFSFESVVQKGLKSATAAEAAAVVVTVEDLTGKVIYNSERVELYSMSGSYISKPLSFVPGGYKLTKFLVVDASNSILYAAPIAGSAKAYLVNNPLPLTFTVTKNVVTKLVPQVLDATSSTPEDFGYGSFSFDQVATFDFLTGVFVYNETSKNFEMTTAHLSIAADSGWVYQKDVPAATDTITVRDNQTRYVVTVTKEGYTTWVDTLNSAELRRFYKSEDMGPLKVILNKSTCDCPATVTDIDGNVYATVLIGTQCWMKENLKVTHYRDNSAIPNVTDNTDWYNLTSGAKCAYNNDESNSAIYGFIYNGYAATDSRGICPTGWHIPTITEWTALETYLGGEYVAGGKIKETGISHWASPNTGATNESGFTALPGGSRVGWGDFSDIGTSAGFWSSTITSSDGYSIGFSFGNTYVYIFHFTQTNVLLGGRSVRCIKD